MTRHHHNRPSLRREAQRTEAPYHEAPDATARRRQALRRKAARTGLLALALLHLTHCPSVTWGPDTGCVQNTQNIGRLFPELVADAGIVLVRVDEGTTAAGPPYAQYLASFTPPAVGALSLLPRLSIDECRCVRADGLDCEADAGLGAGGGDALGGAPIVCPPVVLLGLDPHGPVVKPDAGLYSDTCVFAETDCRPGERCVERKCSVPVPLVYDAVEQRYLPPAATPLRDGGLAGGTTLTVELGAYAPDAGYSLACPADTTTAKLTVVQPTTVLTPAPGAMVSRASPLPVRWDTTGAGFTIAFLRGTRGGQTRTLVCRGLDQSQDVTFPVSLLQSLEPGAVELELVRLNATSVVPLPIQGGALLSVSSQKRALTLR